MSMVKRFLNWENGPLYLIGAAMGVGIVGVAGMIISPATTGLPVAIAGTIGAAVGVAIVRPARLKPGE